MFLRKNFYEVPWVGVFFSSLTALLAFFVLKKGSFTSNSVIISFANAEVGLSCSISSQELQVGECYSVGSESVQHTSDFDMHI